VVSLLPPGNVKLRFFVPEGEIAAMAPGTSVAVRLDGRAEDLTATVSYVSTQAEFTPPVIYSRETRAKLVYMVEATFADPEQGARLRPGQPAEVRPSAAGR
jgi:HlyD family secretion protein